MGGLFATGPAQWAIRAEAKTFLKSFLRVMRRRIPEPTRENTQHPNTAKLCDIRDRFFEHERNKGHEYIFRAVFNFVIALYDFDQYYQHRIDWVIEQIKDTEFKPRPANRPRRKHWDEPVNAKHQG